jgi:hypothetical protein
VPGGQDLLAWFEGRPRFHDAEIIRLDLRRRSESTLDIHFCVGTGEVDARGYFVLDKHVVVTFAIEEIVDLELDGFNHQNVIYNLELSHAKSRPEREPYVLGASPGDYEIELEDCYGMSGFIRCKKVAIRLTPGKPGDVYAT